MYISTFFFLLHLRSQRRSEGCAPSSERDAAGPEGIFFIVFFWSQNHETPCFTHALLMLYYWILLQVAEEIKKRNTLQAKITKRLRMEQKQEKREARRYEKR